MKNILGALICISALAIFASCNTSKKSLIGGQKDSHGCLSAAGYQWSEVRKDCIRIFEDGIQLTSVDNPNATLAAYIVFSKDSTDVEAYIPEVDRHPIMHKQNIPDFYSENPKFVGAYNLRKIKGEWLLLEGDNKVYTSKK